jgi:novobiocin biosynthesis protein NovU/D-mycarose 3-C-methyltransferase
MRATCRGCGATTLEEVLDLGSVPLAGGFLSGLGPETADPRFPLKVHTCAQCRLVQILDAIDPDVLFQNYSFASSTIGPLVDHFSRYAGWLIERFHPAVVVEFGCNDGVLLRPLGRAGVCAVGVDISHNIGDLARANGLEVLTGPFDDAMADRILGAVGPADVVTGSNAFAHNDHPELILSAARRVLRPGGHLCLEVMYAGDLLEQWQWDTLYHEHLTFYSLASLARLLERHGFFVVHAERVPMHGGSLRVAAGLTRPKQSTASLAGILEYEERLGLDRVETWKQFGALVDRKIRIVRDAFAALSSGHSIWAYGAAGKATMWLNACGMTYLGGIVDSSPLRAGKFMPGTHTPIVLPDEFRRSNPDYVFVTAWNYADVIKSKEDWFQGIWATPLPDLRFF